MITKFKDITMYKSIEEDGSVAFDIYPVNRRAQYIRIAIAGIGFLDGDIRNIEVIGVDVI
jgi:hypothetical protein